uniref:Corpuscles of Stannius protein n=1 Tax=Callorhinchus milii TaxID=7868 RepID=A0A4W3ID90_CALMI
METVVQIFKQRTCLFSSYFRHVFYFGRISLAPPPHSFVLLIILHLIYNCLLSAGDVGCAVFECLENHTCEIHNLYEVCRIFLQNAGKFDAQGKLFIKDFLKCNANGIKSRFSCNIRRCSVIQEILSELQKDCYQNFDILHTGLSPQQNYILECFSHGGLIQNGGKKSSAKDQKCTFLSLAHLMPFWRWGGREREEEKVREKSLRPLPSFVHKVFL